METKAKSDKTTNGKKVYISLKVNGVLLKLLEDLLVKFIKRPKLLPKTFSPLSEAFVRRSWYSVLPILDMTGRYRVKKAVVCMAQLVAALITVHGLLSFLSDF